MPALPYAVSTTVSRLLRLVAPFGVTLLCLWFMQSRVELPSPQTLSVLLADVSLGQWCAALLATLVSFWALGRYDLVAHRHMGTGFNGPSARVTGMAAIAVSQTVGLGLITGSFARWRLLPGLRPAQAAQLTGFVAVTFMTALAMICACTSLILPSTEVMKWTGALVLTVLLAAGIASFLSPELKLGRIHFRLPSVTAMLALSVWALVDVVAAGTALWVLLPKTAEIGWTVLLPVYFLALAAAIISSAPGGVGPFELTLFALLPSQATADIVVTVIAFRLVYFAFPALASAILLAWPRLLKAFDSAQGVATSRSTSALPHDCKRSETGVIRQNGGRVLSYGANQLAVLDSPQCAIAMFDPVRGHFSGGGELLKNHADNRNAVACVYKCSARHALGLRRKNWKLLRIAQEAVVAPVSFSEDGAKFRQLRRKLRQAAKAGVKVRPSSPNLPLVQMERVDQAWQSSHGQALGTTMGQFEAGYLTQQKVFLAWQAQEIIGFVSFHTSDTEWCLDLVRIIPGAPDGTGHALIREAIAVAAHQGMPRLSLAAVPSHRFADRVDKGLRRFKACFAPHWQPLYMAAPSWWQMAISIAELLRLVHRPAPLKPKQNHIVTEAPIAGLPLSHNEDEQNAIALQRSA